MPNPDAKMHTVCEIVTSGCTRTNRGPATLRLAPLSDVVRVTLERTETGRSPVETAVSPTTARRLATVLSVANDTNDDTTLATVETCDGNGLSVRRRSGRVEFSVPRWSSAGRFPDDTLASVAESLTKLARSVGNDDGAPEVEA